MVNVLVLGSTGMIGHQVFNYLKFKSVFELYNISFRKKLQHDSILLDARSEDTLVKYIESISPNYIINCVGVLIHGSNRDPENAIFLNSYLPHRLSRLADVINAKLIQQSLGEFENRMVITHNKVDYDIPIIVRVSKATIMVNDDNGKLSFDISSPTSWSYAKISITNKETGKKFTESITPNKNSELIVYQPGEYWVDAKIKNNNETSSAYTTIQVEKVMRDKENFENMLNLPEKPILIISAIMIIITITGLIIRKQH